MCAIAKQVKNERTSKTALTAELKVRFFIPV